MSTGLDSTIFSSAPQVWYGQRDENGVRTGPGGFVKVGFEKLDPLATAGSDKPIMDMVTLSSHIKPVDTNSLLPVSLKPLMDIELQQEPQTTFNYNGREFNAIHPDWEKYLNNPNVKVSETGYLSLQIAPKPGDGFAFSFLILGKAVDAPEYVPPKYTADFFSGTGDYGNFFLSAARDLAKAGIDEIPAKSAVDRDTDDFVKAALDFFGGGKAAPVDIDRMKTSIVDTIKELSEQIKSGGEGDFNKLTGRVDIMGAQVSLSQLLDVQKNGRELTNQLVGENKESALKLLGLGNVDMLA